MERPGRIRLWRLCSENDNDVGCRHQGRTCSGLLNGCVFWELVLLADSRHSWIRTPSRPRTHSLFDQ
jgi:hypothetical protein